MSRLYRSESTGGGKPSTPGSTPTGDSHRDGDHLSSSTTDRRRHDQQQQHPLQSGQFQQHNHLQHQDQFRHTYPHSHTYTSSSLPSQSSSTIGEIPIGGSTMLPSTVRSESPFQGVVPTSRTRSVSTPEYQHSIVGSPTITNKTTTTNRLTSMKPPFPSSSLGGTGPTPMGDRSKSSSPYYNLNLSELDSNFGETPILNGLDTSLSRSAIHQPYGASGSASSVGLSASTMHSSPSRKYTVDSNPNTTVTTSASASSSTLTSMSSTLPRVPPPLHHFNSSSTGMSTGTSTAAGTAARTTTTTPYNIKTIYGSNTSSRNLEDEDPITTSANADHFNLHPSSSLGGSTGAGGISFAPSVHPGRTSWSAGNNSTGVSHPSSSGSSSNDAGVNGTSNLSSSIHRQSQIRPSLSHGGSSSSINDNTNDDHNMSSQRLESSRRRREERAVQRRQHRSMNRNRNGGSDFSGDSLTMSNSEQSMTDYSAHTTGGGENGNTTTTDTALSTAIATTESIGRPNGGSSLVNNVTSPQPALSPSIPRSLPADSNRVGNSSTGQVNRHNSMTMGQSSSYGDDRDNGSRSTPRDSARSPGGIQLQEQEGDDWNHRAKTNSRTLVEVCKGNDIEKVYVRKLLDCCKQDQTKLQVRLSTALEEPDPVDNLEELFGLNDAICSAIEAARNALKRDKERTRKKQITDGPTIGLLVENQDVFSLICMLRAPNEKRLQSALALMKFAKEDQALSNEIRSSGGMHSFLTLFRTKGMTREVQVVASLAVAYILPSFVASSQTPPSVGLKIVECLRFLVISNPCSPNGVEITREEMCTAASVGVNVLWINAIQPLITMEHVKNQSTTKRPSLPRDQSMKFGRFRTKTGGGIFDQGHESIEIQELTELAVTLIAYIAKLVQSRQLNIDIGYDILEQVCEVDEARPIAVREGLLAIFVEWIQSGNVDKIRPAASALRYLISIKDKYMAGWIHSQVVNEGAVREIVKLLNESVGHDVRVAVAQMISTLCVAPHTRAAVVEANCVRYLVALLYEHSAPDSEDMVFCAGSALLQLAAGSMTSANAVIGDTLPLGDSDKNATQENVVTEIIEGWAHGSFVQIALDHSGKLRSVSVEALRVLSEDTNPIRKTRLQLCNAGAAEALGLAIKNHASAIKALSLDEQRDPTNGDDGVAFLVAVKDTYEALRGLANILEAQNEPKKSQQTIRRGSVPHELNPKELLIKGCLDVAKSGGLGGILWVCTLPNTPSSLSEINMISLDRNDLLEESCRLLANLSPLLLSQAAASNGVTRWSSDVFEALDGILKRLHEGEDGIVVDDSNNLSIDALKGMGALALYEPLKIRIVSQTLPTLLLLKNSSGERNDISTAANQVLLSLGFTDDEIAVQVAGNNPQLLVDWFCLQRALLLQAMVRTEVRAKVVDLWHLPLSETDATNISEMRLIRQVSQESQGSTGSASEERSMGSSDEPVIKDLFENMTSDYDSRESRATFVEQYRDVYESGSELGQRRIASSIDTDVLEALESENLISRHVYPLNDTKVEKDWLLNHRRALELNKGLQKFAVSGILPERVEKLLDDCFPSKLLRSRVVPMNDLRPRASFNFRAFMMPRRRYFSFRREGQLLARLCEKHVSTTDSEDVHWTVGFTNSTFAGEFVESLVQTLYLCPMILGLSFVRNTEWLTMRDTEKENDGDDGGGLLANLTGSLPPWVSYLTFDNMLGDRDVRALIAILETMGRLSSGQDSTYDASTTISEVSTGQSQGKFGCLNIRNSPQISRESWSSFFQLLGKVGPANRNPVPPPLSSLKILDLSGNKLGDEAAAMVLELVHDKDSGCCLEQLDLSGNRIGRGTNVIRVLCAYTEYYRYNQTVGVKMLRKSWKSTLHTLILAENDLFLGQGALEMFALLKHNALCLRYLDLSSNSLEGDSYQLLASSLLKNTALCHLNLSGNKFSHTQIDLILDHLNSGDAESGLSFLLFENNSPSLHENHRAKLAKFLRKSRKNAIERHMKESITQGDAFEAGNASTGAGLDLNDEESTDILNRVSGRDTSFQSNQADLGNALDPEENRITVLFSAPLVFADGENQLHPFAKLDFEMERELLWQCMKEASRDISMNFDNAHHSRLLATLTRRCSVLHYSGHGHPAFLPFEDGMGGPNWLDVQDIKELILQDGVVPFKFVFVSACHSGLAGETFASAGVPHVVCCKQESELKDTAALAFTRSFYLALLVGHTVHESFEQGCKAVRATPNLKDPDKEMEKFVLLPKGGNHHVPVFQAKPIREWPKQPRNQVSVSGKPSRGRGSRGSLLQRLKSSMALGAKSSELSVRNMMQDDPSPTAPQFFLGREVEMYYIITALLKLRKRLVSVLGETGIGRSSLVCALCHYINERASTICDIQHIYFIKPKHGGRNVTCRSLLRQLLDKLEDNGKCRPSDEDADTEAMLDTICRSLKQDKALIVFDRTELLEKSDESQELLMILSSIMYETKQVKVVITGRNALGQPSIGGQVEHPFNLGPLNFSNTVNLFANLCPHLHTPSERAALSTTLLRKDDGQKNLLPSDTTLLNSRTKEILSRIGNGVPAKIEKAAYGMSKDDLSRLREL